MSTAYDVWVYNQLEPQEELFMGRTPPRHIPFYAIKFPDYLINQAPPSITEQEWDERQDQYLREHGY